MADLEPLADMAYQLMRGDPEAHKAGYTFANALIAVADHHAVVGAGPLLTGVERARLAEMLHHRLVAVPVRQELEQIDVVEVARHLGMQVLVVDEEGVKFLPPEQAQDEHLEASYEERSDPHGEVE